MSGIKAIETHYNGYRFRSRLEARWAVLFDALGIRYEYEREGFDLGDPLGYYLPDFWLPDLYTWFEIKPGAPPIVPPQPVEVAKVAALLGGSRVLALPPAPPMIGIVFLGGLFFCRTYPPPHP